MCVITKVQQKYKGVRRTERRVLIPKKQLTGYPKSHVSKKKINYNGSFPWYRINENVMYPTYKLIYQ